MDDTYRNQLRELNDLNWERFRSELRGEGAAIRADIRGEMEARFAAVNGRLAAIEARFPTLEQRIDAKFARFEAGMFRTMFMFWLGTIIPLAALLVTLSGALRN